MMGDCLMTALMQVLALFLLMIPAGSTICAAILGCRKDLKKTLGRVALYVSVILFSVFILYPFFVMFITAFRSNAETTDMYFLHILPAIGGMVSGNRGAYEYLPASVLHFPAPDKFIPMMREAGFSEVKHRALTFGICRMYVGIK